MKDVDLPVMGFSRDGTSREGANIVDADLTDKIRHNQAASSGLVLPMSGALCWQEVSSSISRRTSPHVIDADLGA
jgi:hypothetical protein